jgi:hypothetical protein
MPTAYPGNVPGAVTAADQHPALLGLLGFVQLAFVVLHCARMLGLGIRGGGLRLSLAYRSKQKKGSETKEFSHDEMWRQGTLECRRTKPDLIGLAGPAQQDFRPASAVC